MKLGIKKPKHKHEWILVLDLCEALRVASVEQLAAFILTVLPEKKKEDWSQLREQPRRS